MMSWLWMVSLGLGSPDTEALDAPPPEPTTTEPTAPVTVADLLNDPEQLATLARALQHHDTDWVYDGYRLSAIRRHSPLDLLGIMNGDVIHKVAGVAVTSPEEAQEALAAAQAAESFDVVLSRRGQRMFVTIKTSMLLTTDLAKPSAEPIGDNGTEAPSPASGPLGPEELRQRREARLQEIRELRAERMAAEAAEAEEAEEAEQPEQAP